MTSKSAEQTICTRTSEFYDGKSIFLTGSTGYLGSVLLAVLLKCCPGIQKIFLLIRMKKGADVETRKDAIFNKKIFTPWINDDSNIKKKVHIIPGDVSLPFMDMTEEDIQTIAEEVTVVFHCAATVSFLKPLRETVLMNAYGTNNIIQLCRKLKKLEVLVYTSTAYSFSNYQNIEECVYRLPFKAQRYLDELQTGTEESFERLWGYCKPDWPNYYTFSKALAENMLQDNASDLPIAIMRPSIIFPAFKGIMPGYMEEGSGINYYLIMVAKGYARTVKADSNTILDIIPIDIVANAHILAAYSIATKKSPSPLVVNVTGSHIKSLTIGRCTKFFSNFGNENSLPWAYMFPSTRTTTNELWYKFCSFYEHYIPAFITDIMMRLKGKKLRLVSHYRFYHKVMEGFLFFALNTLTFEVKNMTELSNLIHPQEKELFYLDFKELNFPEVLSNTLTGSNVFDSKKDKRSPEERQRSIYKQTLLHNFVKRTFLLLVLWISYIIIKNLFSFILYFI